MSSLKMRDSGLVGCPEIEQWIPCGLFGKGLCPSCYAQQLYPIRTTKLCPRCQTLGHRSALTLVKRVNGWTHECGVCGWRRPHPPHPTTPKRGLIRLGTFLEVLPAMWAGFKRGGGRWACCGKVWARKDFHVRPYFLISRGLQDAAFYERLLADTLLVNLQISVDILDSGRIVPDVERLGWFLRFPRVVFRFKTTDRNVLSFCELQERLNIPRHRIMETPLQTPKYRHAYGTRTPLELVGWKWNVFGRCNTVCRDCRRENGVLLCSARPETFRRLPGIDRAPPPRHPAENFSWLREAERCRAELGGEATVEQAYTWFLTKHPALSFGKPNWHFKIRVALKRSRKRPLIPVDTITPTVLGFRWVH